MTEDTSREKPVPTLYAGMQTTLENEGVRTENGQDAQGQHFGYQWFTFTYTASRR